MNYKPFIIVLLVLIMSLFCFAQTESDLDNKYNSERFYKIRPNILMKVIFGADSRVCEIHLQPNRYEGSAVQRGEIYMSSKELIQIYDELAPAAMRGVEDKLSRLTLTTGRFPSSSRSYENLTITEYFVTRDDNTDKNVEAATIKWVKKSCVER